MGAAEQGNHQQTSALYFANQVLSWCVTRRVAPYLKVATFALLHIDVSLFIHHSIALKHCNTVEIVSYP